MLVRVLIMLVRVLIMRVKGTDNRGKGTDNACAGLCRGLARLLGCGGAALRRRQGKLREEPERLPSGTALRGAAARGCTEGPCEAASELRATRRRRGPGADVGGALQNAKPYADEANRIQYAASSSTYVQQPPKRGPWSRPDAHTCKHPTSQRSTAGNHRWVAVRDTRARAHTHARARTHRRAHTRTRAHAGAGAQALLLLPYARKCTLHAHTYALTRTRTRAHA